MRNKSVGGIKVPISSYDFSNDNRFFVVATENRKIKIFQNFGPFEESKILLEFDIKEKGFLYAEKASLYVSSYFTGKVSGHIAISYSGDIAIYNPDGHIEKLIKNAHETKINCLKIVQNPEDSEKCILISGSRDGKFHIWKLN